MHVNSDDAKLAKQSRNLRMTHKVRAIAIQAVLLDSDLGIEYLADLIVHQHFVLRLLVHELNCPLSFCFSASSCGLNLCSVVYMRSPNPTCSFDNNSPGLWSSPVQHSMLHGCDIRRTVGLQYSIQSARSPFFGSGTIIYRSVWSSPTATLPSPIHSFTASSRT